MAALQTPQTNLVRDPDEASCPIIVIAQDGLERATAGLGESQRRWVEATGYKAEPGSSLLVPAADGSLAAVLYGAPKAGPFAAFEPAALRRSLPAGTYRLTGAEAGDAATIALGWALEGYDFTGFCERPASAALLAVGPEVDIDDIAAIQAGANLGRDLINQPANLLGPAELAEAAVALAGRFGGDASVIVGEDLLENNFPLVHAVGAASARPPRLIDFTWGEADAPAVTLVGKGVCFDTGGLNIKPGSSMELMKKDMGGAANVLALAHMIMAAELKLRLRVIIPAVENSISGAAFRPGDVFTSRKGLSVEIGNTDAEGRLVLADALDLGDADAPELMIDMATLTGAARVALGPDLPPMFTGDDGFAAAVTEAGLGCCDPVWRMPLWPPYDDLLASKIADVNHISGGPFAGSVTAALFLQRFVDKAGIWAHFDVYGWTPAAKPGRPLGGAVQAARALFAVLKQRYG